MGILQQEARHIYNIIGALCFHDGKPVQDRFGKRLFHWSFFQYILGERTVAKIWLNKQQFISCLFKEHNLLIAKLAPVKSYIIAANTAAQGIHIQKFLFQGPDFQVYFVLGFIVKEIEETVVRTEAFTFIRKGIKEKKNIRALMPDNAWIYLDEMNFYK